MKYTSPGTKNIIRDYYGSALRSAITDFLETVKNGEKSEFSDDDALMSLMMESAAKESAANNGKIIKLPIEQELEVEIRKSVTWDRPSWKFGTKNLNYDFEKAFNTFENQKVQKNH